VQALLDIPGLVQQGLQWLVPARQPGPYVERRTAEDPHLRRLTDETCQQYWPGFRASGRMFDLNGQRGG
jgi:hypothetical protein